MTACNDCWDEAFRRAQLGGGHQVEHYEAILLLPPSERPWCAFAQTIVRRPEPQPGCDWGQLRRDAEAARADPYALVADAETILRLLGELEDAWADGYNAAVINGLRAKEGDA